MEYKEQKNIIELKHKYAREIIGLKHNLIEDNQKKKKEYANFLYILKDKHLEKTNKFAVERIVLVHRNRYLRRES